MNHDELAQTPVERRQEDRRRQDVPVHHDRRHADRRAARLAPRPAFAGVAVVVDGWPLLRAGVAQLLRDAAMRVAAEDAALTPALAAVGDRLDLVVLGAAKEPLVEAVKRLQEVRRRDDGLPPRVLVLLDRVEVAQLRALLAMGVEGVVDRSVGQEDLRAACERVLGGQRVLAGGPLSVLASAGLDLSDPADDGQAEESPLTPKELEVLAELSRHLSNREIAETMHVSAATVKTHLSNIYAKLGVACRREAVVAAVEMGLLA